MDEIVKRLLAWLELYEYIYVAISILLHSHEGAKQAKPLHAQGLDAIPAGMHE
jgi:hypothetical protein